MDTPHGLSDATTLRTRIRGLAESLDRRSAVEAALDAVRVDGMAIDGLYLNVLSPLLEETGRSWAEGTEAVWQEHVISQTIRTIIESLYLDVCAAAAEVTPRGQTVLLACPPEERHDLGLRMLADRFALAGYRVVFLGADTPVAEIIAAAQATHADIVALSVSTILERIDLRSFADQLRAALPDTRIVFGGPAFSSREHWPSEDLLDTHELGLERPRED